MPKLELDAVRNVYSKKLKRASATNIVSMRPIQYPQAETSTANYQRCVFLRPWILDRAETRAAGLCVRPTASASAIYSLDDEMT